MTLDNYNLFNDDYFNLLEGVLLPLPKLVSMDGIQSGVPTLTTPTLTPTLSLESFATMYSNEQITTPFQAGFIPPPLSQDFGNNNNQDSDVASEVSQSSFYDNIPHEESSQATTDNSSAATDSTSFQNGMNGVGHSSTSSTTNDFTNINFGINPAAINDFGAGVSNNTSNNSPSSSNRRSGGRRPTQSSNLSPEEEEKRRLRRERNKLAAARCRKRRVDQTNELLQQVEKLEQTRDNMQKEIQSLSSAKAELESILQGHRGSCMKIQKDILGVKTFGGIIVPNTSNGNLGLDGMDFKPNIYNNVMLPQIKNEPEDITLDTSLDDTEGPPSPKRALPDVATLQASLHANSSHNTLNTPSFPSAPISFASLNSNLTLNSLNKSLIASKPRPNSLPTEPRNLGKNLILSMHGKQPTEIHGVPIQTPSTGVFNFDSLMEGGTGLTPNCSQNKLPLELTTPTSEPSKLLSL